MKNRSILQCVVAVLAIVWAGECFADEQKITADQLKFFEAKIRPVLIRECYGCHSSQSGNVRGGLRLDNRELTHIGGDSGAAVVPGDLESSLLYNAMTHTDFVMPPKRKLSKNIIDDFKKWIEMGAPDPRVNSVAQIKSEISEQDIADAKQNFWAYQPPVNHSPPKVNDSSWSKKPVDQFVLARLEESGLPTPTDAEPHKILRRLCFDLIGLPPTPQQIDYFAKQWQQNPQAAVELIVDRLLEKEQFGERWARHWLDAARYAESTGREVNMTYPHAWRYRDFVIDSFNADKPFNVFVQQNIAGDLLPAESDQQWAENLVGTTFLAMGSRNVNEKNRVQFGFDQVDEQIDATTRVFMGMSVACARCHDHKFDAIPQSDYYGLVGIFSNMTTYFGNPPSEFGSFSGVQANRNSSLLVLPVDDPNPYDQKYSRSEMADLKSKMRDLQTELRELRSRFARGDSSNGRTVAQARNRIANQLAEVSAKLAVVDDNGNPRSYCMGVQEKGEPREARVLVRGEIDQPAQAVPRGFPKVLVDHEYKIPANKSGRLELAKWIGSDDNSLTARVMVNRIWNSLLGQGIVASTDNFGVTGQPPSHPELLDYLAIKFVQSDWSVKTIVKEIATSRVYRMSSAFNQRAHDYDPSNTLLWRANPRRLDAEGLRDAMLAISGEIDLERTRGSEVAKAGYMRVRDGVLGDARGQAREALAKMRSNLTAETQQRIRDAARENGNNGTGRNRFRGRNRGNRLGQGMPSRNDQQSIRERYQQEIGKTLRKITNALDMEDAKFRSIYLPIVRDAVPRSLDVFDFPDSSIVVGVRESSNTANQALYMLNNPFVLQQSEVFSERVTKAAASTQQRIDLAFRLAYGRLPTSGERNATAFFLRDAVKTTSPENRSQVFAMFCQSLLASAEFRYID